MLVSNIFTIFKSTSYSKRLNFSFFALRWNVSFLLCFTRDSRSPGYESHVLLPATLSLLKYSYEILGSCSSNSHEGKRKAAILSTGWTSTQVKLWHWFHLWGLPDVIGDGFPHQCAELQSWALGELSSCGPGYGCFLPKVAWSQYSNETRVWKMLPPRAGGPALRTGLEAPRSCSQAAAIHLVSQSIYDSGLSVLPSRQSQCWQLFIEWKSESVSC